MFFNLPWQYSYCFKSEHFNFVTEPGYVATPIALIQAALVILDEEDKLPPGYVIILFFNSVW